MAKGRAKDFKDPDEELAKDYDPEANGHSDNDNGSASEDERAGTEHYVTVGRSKLREKEGLSLGRQYRGSRVSRQALEEEDDNEPEEDDDEDEDEDDEDDDEYDDPEEANLEADTAEASDSEISSDNALAESDDERLGAFVFRGSSKPKKPKSKRPSAADFMSESASEDSDGGAQTGGSDEDEDEDEDMDDGLDDLLKGIGGSDEDDDDDEDEDEEDEEDNDEDEDDEDEDEDDEEEDGEGDESEKQSAKPSLAAPSNQTEVQKGIAIQQQRKIYDGLLNMRIRLQKALVAANTFPTLDGDASSEAEAYEAAEEAAIKLLNTISDLRENLAPPTAAGSKRKRTLEIGLSNEQIWEQLQEDHQRAVKFRQDRLDKWSRKVQSVTVAAPNKLGAKPKTLIEALQDQLANPDDRLVKRTRVPRSCAPAQAAKKITESEDVYDDADFYQLLLKELVDQRTVESAAEQSSMVASVMLTANKEAKTRKVVDRKASKGRKMRFTVHEKLQNFMAPEDRRSWEQEAIDRFFGTLFGQKMELNEEESEDDEMEALYKQDEGLRLFR
ncbi:TRAUB-domain-containing protein [Trichoderma longibrachiatum ATCC 18648]|uniref:Protein BFR2 n=1 Tax=Trichoderma longibrachiatum ATCC 18648 TaxID=983965 RepID=A0A2T4C7Q9_TRILO|nr:TRAUB-domain-containing protein [Trichoderma longibrachiatum ATCC 18648]